MKEEIIGLLKYCGTFNISKTSITTIEEYLDYITELGYIDVSIDDNEFEAIKLIVQDYIDLQTENTKLKQDKQELIEWLKEEIVSQKKSIELLNDKNNKDIHIGAISELKKVLERLG